MCACAHVCISWRVLRSEDNFQESVPLLPPRGFQGSNSGLQAWWQGLVAEQLSGPTGCFNLQCFQQCSLWGNQRSKGTKLITSSSQPQNMCVAKPTSSLTPLSNKCVFLSAYRHRIVYRKGSMIKRWGKTMEGESLFFGTLAIRELPGP